MSSRTFCVGRPRVAWLLPVAVGLAVLAGCAASQSEATATASGSETEAGASSPAAPEKATKAPETARSEAGGDTASTPPPRTMMPSGTEPPAVAQQQEQEPQQDAADGPLGPEEQRKLRAEILRRIAQRGDEPAPPAESRRIATPREQGAGDRVQVNAADPQPMGNRKASAEESDQEPPILRNPQPLRKKGTPEVTPAPLQRTGAQETAARRTADRAADEKKSAAGRTANQPGKRQAKPDKKESARQGGCGPSNRRTTGLTPPPPDAPQPKFVCKESTVTLNEVWRGQKATFKFAVANEGEAPLQIRLKKG